MKSRPITEKDKDYLREKLDSVFKIKIHSTNENFEEIIDDMFFDLTENRKAISQHIAFLKRIQEYIKERAGN